jgi:predicted small secreted protein
MSRFFVTVLAILAVSALAACHTVEGAGKDIQSVGEGVEDAAD